MQIVSDKLKLNDSFEHYYPSLNGFTSVLFRINRFLLSSWSSLHITLFGGQMLINERIVEYPQITEWIRPTGTILDIGCVSSRLPIQLASLGRSVYGLDTRPYIFTHPNFCFYQADLFQWLPPTKFETILLISVIEHFGLGGYGDLVVDDADMKAIQRITTWLQPGGQLLVSLPFGKPRITEKHRIYDMERLQLLFEQFVWIEQRFFQRVEGNWLPSSADILHDIDSPGLPVNGVAILHLQNNNVS